MTADSGEIRPVQAAAFPPLAINIECQDPGAFPCLPHYAAASRLREGFEAAVGADGKLLRPIRAGEILSTSIVLGFPYADVPEMGAATIAVAHDDREAARRAADTLAAGLWRDRDTFRPALLDVESALERALAMPGPVCLLDMGDNVGGGSPGDGTALAREFHRRGIGGSFACICDEEAVRRAVQAGVGGSFEMPVGGRSPEWDGDPATAPLTDSWRVTAVSDGRFREQRPRHGGAVSFDQGPTAVLEGSRGLVLMVTSRRMPPFSLEQLRHAGLDPSAFRLLAAKGVHAPVAAYAEVCRGFVRVDTPGVTSADLSRFCYALRRRPMAPFETV